MNKAAALAGVWLATALPVALPAQDPEPRWTASVPLWKVLSTKGDLVAVHPGPSWLDSRGPVMPAARLGTVIAVDAPAPPVSPTKAQSAYIAESVLPMPREVPNALPRELRDDIELHSMPPGQGPSLMGPSLGLPPLQRTSAVVGPELLPLETPPPTATLPPDDEGEQSTFATERIIRPRPALVVPPVTPVVTPEMTTTGSALMPIAMRVSPLMYPVRPKILPTPAMDKYLSPYHPVRHLEPLTTAASAARLALPVELVE